MNSEEELESGNNISLPTIDDLPFDLNTDLNEIDFSAANEQFLEHYGDLLETVDTKDSDDIGLTTLLQSLSGTKKQSVQEISALYPDREKQYLPDRFDSTESGFVEILTIAVPDRHEIEHQDPINSIVLESSWQDEPAAPLPSEEDPFSNFSTTDQSKVIFENSSNIANEFAIAALNLESQETPTTDREKLLNWDFAEQVIDREHQSKHNPIVLESSWQDEPAAPLPSEEDPFSNFSTADQSKVIFENSSNIVNEFAIAALNLESQETPDREEIAWYMPDESLDDLETLLQDDWHEQNPGLQTNLQINKELFSASWNIPEQLPDNSLDDLETLLQNDWDEQPISPQTRQVKTSPTSFGTTKTTISADRVAANWYMSAQSPDNVLDDLETLLQNDWDEQEPAAQTNAPINTEPFPTSWNVPQQSVDNILDDLETLLQDDWDDQLIIQETPQVKTSPTSTDKVTISEEIAPNLNIPTQFIDSLDLETLLQSDSDPQSAPEETPLKLVAKNEEVILHLPSDQALSNFSTAEHLAPEEDSIVWEVEQEDPIGESKLAILCQPEHHDYQAEMSDFSDSDRFSILEESNELNTIVQDDDYPELAKIWDTEVQDDDYILEESNELNTIVQDDDYPELAKIWDTDQSLTDEMLATQENAIQELISYQHEEAISWDEPDQILPAELQSAIVENPEDLFIVDDEIIMFNENDENSAIDEIMTAFQIPKQEEVQPDHAHYQEPQDQFEDYEYEKSDYQPVKDWQQNNNNDAEAMKPEYTDDYEEWQSQSHHDIDDEDSAIGDIVTTFQFGEDEGNKKKSRSSTLDDSEAEAMMTQWQDNGNDFDDSSEERGVIDWEKLANGKSNKFEELSIDFKSFSNTELSSPEVDEMSTEIRAQRILKQTESPRLLDTVQFDEHDDMFEQFEIEPSLPPLPPRPAISVKTEVKPPFGKQAPSRNLERKDLEKKLSFDDVSDDDWTNLLDEIPPVTNEMFGLSENESSKYDESDVPHQFISQGFQSGETQPANLHLNDSPVSQTAPTFPEIPPTSVRVQQFFDDHRFTFLTIGKWIGLGVLGVGIVSFILTNSSINRSMTLIGLRTGIWKTAKNNKNLKGVDLKGVNLEKVNFSGSDLSGSNLIGTNLRNAQLENATLIRTNFSNARLNLANFQKANLTGATLTSTDLSKTNFRGSKLSQVKLKDRKWAESNPPLSDKGTTCPNGTKGPCRL